MRITDAVHRMAGAYLFPGARAVDATAGNGHDTVFLADRVGDGGRVLAVDIQESAVVATRERLLTAGLAGRCHVVCADHAALDHVAGEDFRDATAVILFNLGYLPGSDHALMTSADSTTAALESARGLLAPGGLLAVTAYPGHHGGAEETAVVESWMASQSVKQYRALAYKGVNLPSHAPRAYFLERLR